MKATRTSTVLYWSLFGSVVAAIIAAHVYQLGSLPCGLYQDEAGVGFNAYLIQSSLRDEHGVFLPLYFQSFGDYKSPLYVYAVAVLVALFGLSEIVVRLPAAGFHLGLLLVLLVLVRRLPDGDVRGKGFVALLLLLAGGFFPWLFTVARISFEVASQPFFFMLALLAVYVTFERETPGRKDPDLDSGQGTSRRETRPVLLSILAGVLVGLTLYSYATSRLFTFAFGPLVFFAYMGRAGLRRLLAFAGGYAVSLVPYLVYLARGGRAASDRFQAVSYLFTDIPLQEKAWELIGGYLAYFSPHFLFQAGDENLRHSIGFTGQAFPLVVATGVVGLWAAWRLFPRRFNCVLLGLFLLAPLGGALTYGKMHSLRGIMIPPLFLLYVGAGAYYLYGLADRFGPRWRAALVAVLLVLTAHAAVQYLRRYFEEYPARSAFAFESWGFDDLIRHAAAGEPRKIYFLTDESDYTVTGHMDFYRIKYDIRMPLELIPQSRGEPDTCELARLPRSERLNRVLRHPDSCSAANHQYNLKCF